MWYLYRTKAKQEMIAKHNLENQGFEAYVPLIYTDLRQKSKDREVMFCRYIFIRLEEKDFTPVKSTRGIQGQVKFGEIPAQVQDYEIARLKSFEDENGLHGAIRQFEKGDKVIVQDGAWAGYEAIIKAKTKDKRVQLLFDSLMSPIMVSVDNIVLA